METHAMVVSAEYGWLSILVNRGITQGERRNFSICHEIAHTFFPDCAEFIRMREKRHETLVPLSERFRASKTATIIKMASSRKRVCAAVFLEPGHRKSGGWDDAAPKMRVVYTVPSPGFRYFIPRNKSVPDDSCVYGAVGGDEVTNGREDWGIPGHPVYDVEAMYLPPLDGDDVTPRAVALVRPALHRV